LPIGYRREVDGPLKATMRLQLAMTIAYVELVGLLPRTWSVGEEVDFRSGFTSALAFSADSSRNLLAPRCGPGQKAHQDICVNWFNHVMIESRVA
jgi:hypothetical protein